MDIKLTEIGNGGEFTKNPKDLALVFGFENMPYLGMFGGNPEASTPVQRDTRNDQSLDWWGNQLLMDGDQSLQFNSITEKTLNNVALTSSGRLQIEEAIKKDLEFMKQFAIVKVSVLIISVDRIAIGIRVQKPENVQLKDYAYIWDATNKGLIDWEEVIRSGGSIPVTGGIFDDSFDFSFE